GNKGRHKRQRHRLFQISNEQKEEENEEFYGSEE
uniref:Si:dkey-117n7.3 n=1 Tax=Cyprinodon variegatus TaxID=28743 RepID=A0A3Q2E1C9_CYPVA